MKWNEPIRIAWVEAVSLKMKEWAFLWYEALHDEPAIFETPIPRVEAAKKLKSLRTPILKYWTVPQGEVVVRPDFGRFVLHVNYRQGKSRPFSKIFIGRFNLRDGKTCLTGFFGMGMADKILLVIGPVFAIAIHLALLSYGLWHGRGGLIFASFVPLIWYAFVFSMFVVERRHAARDMEILSDYIASHICV